MPLHAFDGSPEGKIAVLAEGHAAVHVPLAWHFSNIIYDIACCASLASHVPLRKWARC
jgi:hypothetical protein